MKRLAIETSSTACSVALAVDGVIASEHVVQPRAHTQILVPMIDRLLGDAGLAPSDLDAVVLGNGPGSFIGMRIGASVAQGLCFAAGIDLIPVSSLAAIAADVFSRGDADRVIVTQDARMQEVYVGVYDRGDDGMPMLVDQEYIAPVSDLGAGEGEFHAAGGGWARYPDLIYGVQQPLRTWEDCVEPDARFLLTVAEAGDAKTVAPEYLVPAYLRQKVADVPAR